MHCLLPGGAATSVLLKTGETDGMGLVSPNQLCVEEHTYVLRKSLNPLRLRKAQNIITCGNNLFYAYYLLFLRSRNSS